MSEETTQDPARRAPPCEVCAARKDAMKKIYPFQRLDLVHCPACHQVELRMWETVCNGRTLLVVRNGFWFLRRWGRVTRVCRHKGETPAPTHFHFECQCCKHRWEMLTALEKPIGAPA